LRINVLRTDAGKRIRRKYDSTWGYNPSFYFAPDKYYGPKNELKKLIDECHKRGIAVVIDMVLNHSYGQSPFVQMYMDNWTITADNPWYNQKANFANPRCTVGLRF
jgi:1,4-alpha-glucan branching enzyme